MIVRETFDAAVRSGREALQFLGVDKALAEKLSTFYYHRDRHSVRRMAEAYDPEAPRFGNTKMANIARAVDAETAEMMQALLRGEEGAKKWIGRHKNNKTAAHISRGGLGLSYCFQFNHRQKAV